MATGNTFIFNQDKASDFDNKCDETQLCEPCVRNKSSKAATVFCKDCTELFCDQCSHLHTIFKPGKHDIISFADMDSIRMVVDMKGMDVCQEHNEKIKFYCQEHSKLCCSTCAFLHRKCEHVDEISSLSEQTRSELYSLKESLQKLESEAEYVIADCEKSANDLQLSIDNMSKEVAEMKNRFIKLFEDAEMKMVTEANAVKCEEMKRLGGRSAECAKIKEEIAQIVPTCSSVLEHGTPQQMFILSKLIDENHHRIKGSISAQQVQLTPKLSMSFPRELNEFLALAENVIKMNCEQNKTGQQTVNGYRVKPIFGCDLQKHIKIGTRVVRGADWGWGEEDGGGPGTVIKDYSVRNDKWVEVKWNTGSVNSYRVGDNGKYELFILADY